MNHVHRIHVVGAGLLLAALAGCADQPVVMTRSALDGKSEPAITSDAWARHSQSRHASPGVVGSSPANPSSSVTSAGQGGLEVEKHAPAELPFQAPKKSTTSDVVPRSEEKREGSVVVITTNLGRIVIAVDEQAAPKTAANFEKLALHGFYNRTIFHRVIPGFMIQGGDPNSRSDDRALYGTGGPGYTLPAEISLPPVRGAVAMARLPDQVNPTKESSGSQFFICVADCPHLQGGYTVFGHVIQGMDVADKIAGVQRDDRDDPLERIEMQASLEPKSKAL